MSAAIVAISKLAAVRHLRLPKLHPSSARCLSVQILPLKDSIKQEDDKTYLDHRPPNIFFH
jgi:hypothetical protein